MSPNDRAAILAELSDDTEITITVKLRDFVRARQAANGGPEYITPADAARLLGWSPRYWAQHARRGDVAGAIQSTGGQWRLPIEACRAHIRAMRRKPAPVSQGPRLVRSVPRGPQRKAQ